MTTSTMTPIEFAHRPLERPASYRLWTRLLDHWQGRRDGRHLSIKQGQAVELESTAPVVLPTPWIARVRGMYTEIETRERITLARVIDPLAVALSQLPPAVTSRAEDPDGGLDHPSTTGPVRSLDGGVSASTATTTGETFEAPHERQARRDRQDAAARAAEAAAAKARLEAAARDAKRRAEFESRIALAQEICAHRIGAAHALLERRLASYGRGLQRTAPSSAVLEGLLGHAFVPELPAVDPVARPTVGSGASA